MSRRGLVVPTHNAKLRTALLRGEEHGAVLNLLRVSWPSLEWMGRHFSDERARRQWVASKYSFEAAHFFVSQLRSTTAWKVWMSACARGPQKQEKPRGLRGGLGLH